MTDRFGEEETQPHSIEITRVGRDAYRVLYRDKDGRAFLANNFTLSGLTDELMHELPQMAESVY